MPSPKRSTRVRTTPLGETAMRDVPKGGRLRIGNPGNVGGGRKPDTFAARCRAITDSPAFLDKLEADAIAGDKDARRMVAEYAIGKPTETKRVTVAGKLVVSFTAEGRRGKGQ